MNDYEQTVQDLNDAIITTETAYYNAQDDEDQAKIDNALDILRAVRENVMAKV